MPRQVDRKQRRRSITAVATKLLAERGPAALTLRELAREMGGSITLITHFYPNRSALLEGITGQLVDDYDADLAALEAGMSPADRLRVLLEWMLPLDERSRREELARIMLLRGDDVDLPMQRFFDALEAKMRALLRDRLAGVLPEGEVEPAVEILRVFFNGVVLSSAEHPDEWPPSRQLALLERNVALLGLFADVGREPEAAHQW
jgi:AcrR family transcriptional regulator